MAITKDAFMRFRILDECFSNPFKNYTIDSLLEQLNDKLEEIDPKFCIGLRQLRYDIAYMTGPDGWDIEFVDALDGKKKIYRYADPEFSIFQQPLNNTQLELITGVVKMLESYTDSAHLGEMADALKTLKLVSDDSRESEKIIGLDILNNYKGSVHKQPLYDAIKAKYSLEVTYQPFNAVEPSTGAFHPQFIKAYNNRWFALGCWDNNRENQVILPLDRIVKIIPLQKPKYYKAGIDWDAYFKDIVGVSLPKGEPKQMVHLRFYNGRGRYAETKPIHSSQEPFVDHGNGVSETKLHVIITRELKTLLLSYGNELEVLAPEELVKDLKEIAEAMATLYKKAE
jgi:predicted DNA-binding transcriptional regulator YafY